MPGSALSSENTLTHPLDAVLYQIMVRIRIRIRIRVRCPDPDYRTKHMPGSALSSKNTLTHPHDVPESCRTATNHQRDHANSAFLARSSAADSLTAYISAAFVKRSFPKSLLNLLPPLTDLLTELCSSCAWFATVLLPQRNRTALPIRDRRPTSS